MTIADIVALHGHVLTVQNVADLLKCCRTTVYDLVASGQLGRLRLGDEGKKAGIRITAAQLAEFIARNTRGPMPAEPRPAPAPDPVRHAVKTPRGRRPAQRFEDLVPLASRNHRPQP